VRKFAAYFIIAAGISCIVAAARVDARSDSITRDDIARAREESARRLERIQADLDALKTDVSATGIACQETRNRR
jgi:hypothetical protein